MEILISQRYTSTEFSARGFGEIEIDWGDNTPLERIVLDEEMLTVYHHSFDNHIATPRKIRVYGYFSLQKLDLTALRPSSVFMLFPLYIEEFILRNCSSGIGFMHLLEGTFRADLTGMKIRDFDPLVECRELLNLDLTGIDTLRESLDQFLIDLVKKHYGRLACHIRLSEQPSGEYREPDRDEYLNYIIASGMEAVWLLCNEPTWNEGGLWSFDINGTTYANEQDY